MSTEHGGICLFLNISASHGIYKNFELLGHVFLELVASKLLDTFVQRIYPSILL